MTYQLTAPLLDACVLGIVDKEDAYGYTLTQKAQQVVDISESTLYPVLRRLQKSGLLSTYDVPFQGRNRRYYSITSEGKNALSFYKNEWVIYRDNIDGLLGMRLLPEPTAEDTTQPATEEPATEEPATEEPATEEPATEKPANEEPANEGGETND